MAARETPKGLARTLQLSPALGIGYLSHFVSRNFKIFLTGGVLHRMVGLRVSNSSGVR